MPVYLYLDKKITARQSRTDFVLIQIGVVLFVALIPKIGDKFRICSRFANMRYFGAVAFYVIIQILPCSYCFGICVELAVFFPYKYNIYFFHSSHLQQQPSTCTRLYLFFILVNSFSVLQIYGLPPSVKIIHCHLKCFLLPIW